MRDIRAVEPGEYPFDESQVEKVMKNTTSFGIDRWHRDGTYSYFGS